MKRYSVFAILVLAMGMLAACAGDSPVPDIGDHPATSTATPEPAPAATEIMTDEGDLQSPPVPSATPTLRPGLEATDPASVDLASGKPTLLEFFAFW